MTYRLVCKVLVFVLVAFLLGAAGYSRWSSFHRDSVVESPKTPRESASAISDVTPDQPDELGLDKTTDLTEASLPEANAPPSTKTAPMPLSGQQQSEDSRNAFDPSSQCNPYYAAREWSVWRVDDPAKIKLPRDFKLTPPRDRLYPTGDAFLACVKSETPYAGFWDDLYVSQDNFHSQIAGTWSDAKGHSLKVSGQIPILGRGFYSFGLRGNQINSPATVELKRLGASFTSQSTTGMGHHIANDALQVLVCEREFYFSNVLRCGPAHTSFREISSRNSIDEYEALLPCIFNSVGSSGSESWGLTKMAIAGGYLPTEVKLAAKLRGVYPSVLLYLWKAALPFDVPYSHELRHRVAYMTDGSDRARKGKLHADSAILSHTYDDALHLRRMVNLAKSLKVVPPITVIDVQTVSGGKLKYQGKTAALVSQDVSDVSIQFSTRDSFDLQGLPIDIEVTKLYGSPGVQTRKIDDHRYEILVPSSLETPAGRTCFSVVASNRYTKSNPAIISVFRTLGSVNQRPVWKKPEKITVVPGNTTEVPLEATDPEGSAVSYVKHVDSPGKIIAGRFVWECPPDQREGDYPVTVIASDGTCGHGYAAVSLPIEVRRVVALASADKMEGSLPLKVAFSSDGSYDAEGGKLRFNWDFGDGEKAIVPNPEHTFQDPGLHHVELSVSSRSGTTKRKLLIHAKPNWPKLIENGWNEREVLTSVWSIGSDVEVKSSSYQRSPVMQIRVTDRSHKRKAVTTVAKLHVPLYVECDFIRGNHVPGSGVEVFGAMFGRGVIKESFFGKPIKFAPDLSFTQTSDVDGEVDEVLIGDLPKKLLAPAQLRLYVTPDSAHPGRYVFSGFLKHDGANSFFRVDNRPVTSDRISILAGELGLQQITKFNVWGPPSSIKP